jgi:hypothetical protein
LIASLEKLMGTQQTKIIMEQARAHCGTNNPGDPLLGLTKMTVWLSKQKGLASVVGQSMTIRIKFYNSIYRPKEEYA